MKKLIIIVLVILGARYVWQNVDIDALMGKVEVSIDKLKEARSEVDTLVAENNRMQSDMYQLLMLMNEVTINTMQLEQAKEGNQGNIGSIEEQLNKKMVLLKRQLAEAREHAKENAELAAEVNRLEKTFRQRERTIQLLLMESDKLDEDLAKSIVEIEHENALLDEENMKLREKNSALKAAFIDRIRAEVGVWELAGDELVTAAKAIPRGNINNWNRGKQSEANKPARTKALQNAFTCYNNGIKQANRYIDNRILTDIVDAAKASARRLQSKAYMADDLLQRVNNDEPIGPED